MNNYKYLVIGSGMTADAAIKGIREKDPEGTIGLISMETNPPYKRPLLSKGLWKGKPFDSVWCKTDSQNVSLHLGRKIVSIDPENQYTQDDQGNKTHWEKLLLATGGTPRRLPFGGNDILYFRTLEDYKLLLKMSEEGKSFAIIGGGFIGAEIAAALSMNNKKVTMLFPEEGIGARIYPHDLSQFLNDYFRNKGVEVLPGEQVTGLNPSNKQFVLNTASGRDIVVDGVIAGIGIEPNIELARATGLNVDKGILVDESLVTSHPNIYAAGDVAEFFNPALGRIIRVEHEDNAINMGRQVGLNMAGALGTYDYLPYFYSDLFELGYEGIGALDSRLTTISDWAEPFQKGVIYYLKDGRVSGVLLWNVWDKVPLARELIAKSGPFLEKDLKAIGSSGWRIQY
jgi:3-phenylpropionate/trans-cinnamate dioxygenase ferredoxin reductase subunit